MSFLNSYRLNFWGGFSTNVCTANNDDRQEYVADSLKAMLGPKYIGMEDEKLLSTLKAQNPVIKSPIPLASWNYLGDHAAFFKNAKISSFGSPGSIEESGTTFGVPVNIMGSTAPGDTGQTPHSAPVMVDIDSTGTTCTQIFVGGLLIGDNENPLLRIKHDTKCFTRSIGGRVLNTGGFTAAAAMWQLSFPYDPEHWTVDETNPQIAALMKQVKQAKGLVVGFSCFEVDPVLSGQELLDQFANGEMPSNPGIGLLVGSIGVWHEDDMQTSFAGRELFPADNQSISGSSAFAIVDEESKILSVNLFQAIFKANPRTNMADTRTISPNVDPGNLSVYVQERDTKTKLVDLAYDHVNYYKACGIVDVGLTSEQIALSKKGALVISSDAHGDLLKESEYRIENDQRGLILDPHQSEDVHFRIRRYGQTLQEAAELTFFMKPSGGIAGYDPQYKQPNVEIIGLKNNKLVVDPSNSEDFSITIKWKVCGSHQINMTVSDSSYYVVVKSYNDDQYNDTSWDTVYSEVLRYYYIIFPAMSLRFPLNFETTVKQLGPQILKRISEEYEQTTLYMPITRSMSPGKRKLLKNFLESDQIT